MNENGISDSSSEHRCCNIGILREQDGDWDLCYWRSREGGVDRCARGGKNYPPLNFLELKDTIAVVQLIEQILFK